MSAPGISAVARATVRARVESMMTATVVITRPGANAFDPVSGEVTGDAGADVIYTGNARVRTTTGNAVTVGGGMVDTLSTLISIPIASPMPYRDDIVTVTADDAADVTLDARAFRVLEVEGGSLFGDARRMTCTALAPSRYWGES